RVLVEDVPEAVVEIVGGQVGAAVTDPTEKETGPRHLYSLRCNVSQRGSVARVVIKERVLEQLRVAEVAFGNEHGASGSLGTQVHLSPHCPADRLTSLLDEIQSPRSSRLH